MSRKLEGNGRWESSRMMLPEHREQHLDRRRQQEQPIKPIEMPTREELQLIRDVTLLPFLLSLVEKNAREVEMSSYTLKPLYIAASQKLLKKIHDDLVEVRKKLRQQNIKVQEDQQEDNIMYYRFVCRGYEDRFPLVRDVVRAEMSIRMGKYIASLFKDIPNN